MTLTRTKQLLKIHTLSQSWTWTSFFVSHELYIWPPAPSCMDIDLPTRVIFFLIVLMITSTTLRLFHHKEWKKQHFSWVDLYSMWFPSWHITVLGGWGCCCCHSPTARAASSRKCTTSPGWQLVHLVLIEPRFQPVQMKSICKNSPPGCDQLPSL